MKHAAAVNRCGALDEAYRHLGYTAEIDVVELPAGQE